MIRSGQFLTLALAFFLGACSSPQPSVLVFSATNGFRHASIEAGQAMLAKMAEEEGYQIQITEDSTVFHKGGLASFDAVVFLMTTMDVLDGEGERELQRFIQAGGGYVGIHSATDTEYDWPWYGRMVGAYFTGHPAGTPEGVITVTDSTFGATAHLPATWTKIDEWYDMRSTNRFVNVLLTVDEFTYKTAQQNPVTSEHPIAWYHEFEGGRSFYTALGHTEASYTDPLFVEHIRGGLEWAIGQPGSKDYSAPTVRPSVEAFSMTVLADTLNEPMELDVLPDGRVIFIERAGQVHLVDPVAGTDVLAATIPVVQPFEDGLLGMALDPAFSENGWVYLYYSTPEVSANRLSRFTLTGSTLDLESESFILDVVTQRDECCHAGGSVEFGPDGTLYVSAGDDTNPFASSGFSPSDPRPGRAAWDAQRTSANSADLRGKIMRVKPLPEGGYEIPAGNLFPADGSRGRPEIFAMGLRNPFRIDVDQRTGWLYWGDVGPDASDDDSLRGPKGHDEINQARGPGFFGWPYFVGNNKPYAAFDFAREVAGDFAVEAAPSNESPNNTGRTFLPPAQGAWIWYPYSPSKEFPLLEQGGRTAMAGPVYYADDYADADGGFPEYYSGRLFMYEWMRNRIYTVDIDEWGWYGHMETFLEGTTLSRPMDLRFGPNGDLYVLEYGNVWNKENPDARLTRIAYNKSW
ncbi:MAG: cytochrome c [Rhodothermales bacterium]|jgi:cytochrome c